LALFLESAGFTRRLFFLVFLSFFSIAYLCQFSYRFSCHFLIAFCFSVSSYFYFERFMIDGRFGAKRTKMFITALSFCTYTVIYNYPSVTINNQKVIRVLDNFLKGLK